jgi:serine/threonine-protein kinase
MPGARLPEAAGGVTIGPMPQEANLRPPEPSQNPSQLPADTVERTPQLPPQVDPSPAGSTDEPASTEPQPADPPMAEPADGRLTVVVEPWADVSIDGQSVGTTPLNGPLALRAGTHRVVLRNPDFPEHSVDVRVEPGESERLAVSLWTLVARVSVEVSPWAEVSVNGRDLGTTPLRRAVVLPPGTHTLTFRHPTLGSREERVTLAAGETRTVRVRLTDGTP